MNTRNQEAYADDNQFGSSRVLQAVFIAAAIVGALGIGGVAARDAQPAAEQRSIWEAFQYLAAHPAVAFRLLPIVALYEIVLGTLYFSRLVSTRLANKWARGTADRLDTELRLLFSPFLRRYRKNLWYHLRDVDLRGIPTQVLLSLELDRVFVDLKIEQQVPHLGQANPVQPLPSSLRRGQHPFFEFLAPPRGDPPHLVIIGPPGSGKTTQLRRAAWLLISRRPSGLPPRLRGYVPILLYLREHATQVQRASNAQREGNGNISYSLEDAVNDHLHRHAPDIVVPKGWLLRKLRRGRCIVLFDGLDEVADLDQRRSMVMWVQEQMLQHASCRFVVTSRPHGYQGNTLYGVTVLSMCPYTRVQIGTFVRKWYHATEIKRRDGKDDKGVRQKALQDAEKLLRRIDDLPDIYELATNPLLLTMICAVHMFKGALPGSRVNLYRDVCDVLLSTRQSAKDLDVKIAEDKAKRVLAPLAWAMMKDRRSRWPTAQVKQAIAAPLALVTDMDTDAFLQYMHESGLLLELELGEFGFAHLTFQEYLAALHTTVAQLEQELISKVGSDWWSETIRLYCAQTDATRVIGACLPQDGVLPNANALALALSCLEEAQMIQPATRSKVQEVIDQCVEAPDAERQHIAAEALLAKRVKDLAYLAEAKRYSETLITCAEYQLFLDEELISGRNRQPIHWRAPHFSVGDGHKAVLGVSPVDANAFCEWLTQRESSRGNNFRLPQIQEVQGHVDRVLHTSDSARGFWAGDNSNDFVFIDGSRPALVRGDVEWLSMAVGREDIVRSQKVLGTALSRALSRVHILEASNASTRTLESARALVITIETANTRAHSIVDSLQVALETARARDLARAIARAPIFVRAYARARTNPRAHLRDLARARDLAYDLQVALEATLNGSLVLDDEGSFRSVLAPGLDLEDAFTIEGARVLAYEAQDSARLILLLAAMLLPNSETQSAPRQWLSATAVLGPQQPRSMQFATGVLVEMYLALVILKGRSEGWLDPYEGILIVGDTPKVPQAPEKQKLMYGMTPRLPGRTLPA